MVHRTSFVIAPGGMFLVPKGARLLTGNMYNIRNVSQREARIFFAQARSVSAPMTSVVHDGQTVFSHTQANVERGAAPRPRGRPRKRESSPTPESEEDDESFDGTASEQSSGDEFDISG